MLRAVRGTDGSEMWTVADPNLLVNGLASPAAGDIDSDGNPEIVVAGASGELLCFEHDGSLKWRGPTVSDNWGGAGLVDLEGDGTVEIVYGNMVVNADGTVRWYGEDDPALNRCDDPLLGCRH